MNKKNIIVVKQDVTGQFVEYSMDPIARFDNVKDAKRLIEAGFSVLLIDKNNHIGGKVNSENSNGYTVDKGFHVVLTNYPEIKRNISIDQLKPLFLFS